MGTIFEYLLILNVCSSTNGTCEKHSVVLRAPANKVASTIVPGIPEVTCEVFSTRKPRGSMLLSCKVGGVEVSSFTNGDSRPALSMKLLEKGSSISAELESLDNR